MSHTVVHSPIHEAELFLGGEAQHLQSNDRLYQAYTQDYASPLSLYIGQDVATLLANPTVQGQIASKLHSTPNLVQIKVTPQRELFVAKTGTNDFQRIDFEKDTAPPEVIAIAEKSQKLYLAMQPSLAPRREEDFDPRTREWSRGYPTPASFSETAQLHERIHSLESQLANERLRGDMREMREDIRENRGLLLELLRSRDTRSPATDREIETLRRQLERTTGQVDRLIDQARDRGLAHSAEMHDLLRENEHLRRVCAGSQEDLRQLEAENDDFRRAYGETRHELGALHEALVSDTTEGALENLRRLERTIDTLREREGTLQEALEVDLPEDMLAKVFEIRGANVELRRQLHDTQGALEEYQERDHQATHEIRRLRHTVSDLNLQFRHDQQLIHRLIQEVKELKARGAGNEERIEQLTGQLREFHDRLYPSDHETAVVTLDGIIERMNALSRLEGSLQDILEGDGPEDIIQRVFDLRESHGELGARLEEATRGAETLQKRLEESDRARGEFEQSARDLRLALQAEKEITTSLRRDLALEKEETARLGAALEEEQVRSSDLLQQKGQVEEQLGLATREVERLGALSRDLTEQLRVSEEDRGRLGREKDQVEEALGRATRKAEQLGEQLHGVTERLRISEETGVALKEEVATLGRRVEDLERENATLLDQRNGAREALASLKHTHGEAEKRLLHVEAELLGERENVQRAEEQSEALRRELSAQKRDLEGQVRDLTAEVREGEKAHGAVTRKLEDAERALKGNQRELQRLDEALRKAQASAKHWEDESRKHDGNHREALVANLELQRQHGLREASLLQEIQLKGTTVSQAQDEFARVSEIARVQGEELVGLQRDLESGRKAFAALQLEHQKALREIDHVGGIAKEQERRLADLEEQLALKKDSLVGAEREIEHVGGIVLKQERQLEELGTELERSREEFNALRLEHSQALEELQAEKEKGLALQTKLEQVNRESLEQFAELNALHEEAQQRLLSENQELTRERNALLDEKSQLEAALRGSEAQKRKLLEGISNLTQANEEQEAALGAQRREIKDLSNELAHVRKETEERNAAYEKQIAELSQRLTPLEALQLREELALEQGVVSRLTEELRLEREKATAALEEVGRRASPQETQKRDETIARLEEELRAASERSEELDSQLSVERAQRLESASQHSDEVSRLRETLREVREEARQAKGELETANQLNQRAQRKVERLTSELESSNSSSLEETLALKKELSEQKKAARQAKLTETRLSDQVSSLTRKTQDLQAQLSEQERTLHSQLHELSEQVRLTKEALAEANHLKERALQKVDRLTSELESSNSSSLEETLALKKELSEQKKAARQAKLTETRLNDQVSSLTRKTQDLQAQLSQRGEELALANAERLESQSQHESDVALLREKLKELQASLKAAERQVEERLSPEEERELRAQLQAKKKATRELTASLSAATRVKESAERDVLRLKETLESRGSLSEREIEALRKQLREAEGAAERATHNAAESERRFKEADGERRQLQDEVLLLKRLNVQFQVDADDAVALRKILADIAIAVGTSEGPSALPGIVSEKISELQEKHALLEKLSDQIIHPDSLARQLGQVELSMLPSALEGRLREVSHLREEHEETLAEVSRKDQEIFSLRQALGEAKGSLGELDRTREALRERESALEQLTRSAEEMESEYQEQVRALKKEIGTLKDSVEERQGVVEEFYDKMVTAEEQRDAAIEQRDTARLAVSEKERTIEEFSSRIDELEEESLGLRRDVEQRGKTIQRQLEELHEQRERLGEQDGILEDNFLAIAKLERVNKARRARLEENEREIEELRHKVGSLREENDRLKLALEHISAVLKVSFTIEDPEELSASLIGRVKEIQASRSQLQEAFDTHTQYLAVAKTAIEERDEQIEELTQTAFAQRKEFEIQIHALDQEVHSLSTHLKEARAQVERYNEELRSAHSLNETISESAAKDRALAEGQQKHLVAQIRELEHALQEREIRYEELKGAYRAARAETARLHERIELTQVQRDIQQAVNAGEVMEVLGAALGGDAFSLQLGPGDRALREVTRNHQDYLTIASQLEEMRALAEETAKTKGISLPAAYDLIRTKYYGRHAQHVSSLIAKINSSPGALNKLDLFVDFFKVTGGVSGITRTREFARLTAVRRVLARLHPERDAERIAALNVQTADLTRVLLRNLMGSIYEATKAGSGVTRYNNFGLHLIMWEDILNNLDDSLYVDGDRTKPLKAKDAESLRRTVRQLNVQFHRLMASTHHQTSPGVWAPNT
ncbi:MAG: hypothetical protein KFB95_02390 [Simkaniaceae bacterium]|nr:MAG: hypothetical protein KFB95_02390 [Simkaniaceae bacterium]